MFQEANSLAAALIDIDTAHRRFRHTAAREVGLSSGELTALIVVGSASDITPKRLGYEVDLSTGAVTALIDRLEVVGYMARVAHPRDRRSLLLVLTPSGEELVASVTNRYAEAVESASSEAVPSEAFLAQHLHHVSEAINWAAIRSVDAA